MGCHEKYTAPDLEVGREFFCLSPLDHCSLFPSAYLYILGCLKFSQLEVGDMFDTDVLDRALKTRRGQRNRERVALIDRVACALRVCRDKYGVREAFIVGSLLYFYRWDHKSDVDVAISGASMHVLDVMKVVEDAVERDVDVINLDLHMFADRFRQKGMKIYG